MTARIGHAPRIGHALHRTRFEDGVGGGGRGGKYKEGRDRETNAERVRE